MCRLSWFLDPGGWSKTAAVRLYFIFPGICTLSLYPKDTRTMVVFNWINNKLAHIWSVAKCLPIHNPPHISSYKKDTNKASLVIANRKRIDSGQIMH
ncbi:hypothetical protein STEG23_016950 [Scotinomys teguina]